MKRRKQVNRPIPFPVADLRELFKDFIETRRLRGCSPRTIETYQWKLKGWFKWLEKNPQPLTKAGILEFFDGLCLKTATKRSYWTSLRTYLNWLYNEGYTPYYLGAGVSPRCEVQPDHYPISHVDALALIDNIPKVRLGRANSSPFVQTRNQMLYLVAIYTGARLGEVVALRPQDVNFKMRCITLSGKGNKTRIVPMAEPLIEHFKAYWPLVEKRQAAYVFSPEFKPDKPMRRDDASKNWIMYIREMRRQGFPIPEGRIRGHDLRHCLAQFMYDSGCDLSDVQHQLGHSDLQTTQIYAKRSVPRMRKQMDRLFGAPAEPQPEPPQLVKKKVLMLPAPSISPEDVADWG